MRKFVMAEGIHSIVRSRARLAAAASSLLLLGACSLVPPSLRPMVEEQNPALFPSATPAEAAAKAAKPDAEVHAGAKTYPGSGNFVNAKPLPPQPPPGPEEASLNFEGLDVREVAKVILGDYLKQSYTVHPAVSGVVTFRTIKPIPLKDLLPTLEMLLRQNNAAVVQEEGIYKILPITAVRGSISPQLGGSSLPIPAGYSVMVIPLKYVGAAEMVKLLEPFAADNTVRADTIRNLLIIAGNQREMRHLIDTVELFDVDWLAGYSVGLFPIRGTDVKSLVADLDRVFGAQAQSPLAGIVRVIPIERLNALLVVTTQPRYLELAKTWVERIDQAGGTTGGTRFFVYQVKNGKAENLAQLVSDLFSARRTTTTGPSLAPGARPATISSPTPFGQTPPQTTTSTVTPAPGAATFTLPSGVSGTANEVRVIADKDTNSLLILAVPSDYEVIIGALKQLDVVRRQVLVEVYLAEVKLTDNLSFGLSYFLTTRNNTTGTMSSAVSSTVPSGLPTANGAFSPTGVVPPFAPGLQLINFAGNEVRAVLNTLGTDGKAKVLAAPQIMVLDNEKAEIKVGDRVSVQTGSSTGVTTGIVNSFQYLDTGILLAVTPRINSGGMVTLEINQEVSVPDSTTITALNPNPTINTRNAKTSVVVANGESIVLGGLIREVSGRNSSGIPLLSKIPILGIAFGSQSYNRERTELVLIVTPKIISDPYQARAATEELRDKLPALRDLMPKTREGPPAGMPPPAEAGK